MSKLNALIAGSTGYIGIQLIKLLVKQSLLLATETFVDNK